MPAVKKRLTRNDTGETGSNQAGIAVPSSPDFLAFFPKLPEGRNPSVIIQASDPLGQTWHFRYVYYNNKMYGGTRDERRLTRTTPFLKHWKATTGDVLVIVKNKSGSYRVELDKSNKHDDPVLFGSNQEDLDTFVPQKVGKWTISLA